MKRSSIKKFGIELFNLQRINGLNGFVKIQQVIYGAKNRRGPSCTDADEDGHQFDRNRGTWAPWAISKS